MNAPFIPTQEATKVASLPWTAVVQPCMGRWEPVILAGHPARFNSPGIARAFASGHPGAWAIYMGMSPLPPSMEAIRAVANPPRETCPPVSLDIEAMDGGHDQKSAFASWRPA